MYRIYTITDYADTMRDPDNIVRKDLETSETLESALSYASGYIESTQHKMGDGSNYWTDIKKIPYGRSVKLSNNVWTTVPDGWYWAFGSGSWAPMIIIEPV